MSAADVASAALSPPPSSPALVATSSSDIPSSRAARSTPTTRASREVVRASVRCMNTRTISVLFAVAMIIATGVPMAPRSRNERVSVRPVSARRAAKVHA
ncbi:MAG TPA: hypothetical protein VE173_00615 [Longimicrobiales bacterium]|nr:hypothetical protein [Longimicrobiales bacterium]